MNRLIVTLSLLLMGVSAIAQTKPASTTTPPAAATVAAAQPKSASPSTPPAVVSLIGDVTGKRFLPDTAFAALSEEDVTLLAKEPVANWGLPMESGKNMSYYNLVVGTRSYQLVITKVPTEELPVASLLRFTTPKSKPEYIARGTLKPKVEEKAK